MYKCNYCGCEFDETTTAVENGMSWEVCPRCESDDFSEVIECAICGDEHFIDDLHGGVCNECIEKYKTNFDTCYGTSRGETDTYKLSAIFATLFSDDEIDSMLRAYIKEHKPDLDCSDWVDADLDWFGENLIKEVIS